MQNSLDKLNNLFIVVLVNILPDKYFKTVFSGWILHDSLLQLLFELCDFLNVDNSQGGVARYLRCGGIFKYDLLQIYQWVYY